jgi:hypothetical protein
MDFKFISAGFWSFLRETPSFDFVMGPNAALGLGITSEEEQEEVQRTAGQGCATPPRVGEWQHKSWK